ncbi:Putative E3 ubiquitin-protein ligase RING1a [Apostasia shenzhenica]|uniref:E3 ubiquitin-protein ligase RING1a n=1 Tax=Apostasia shenzhenica TaxID=1088818 RepID=A0A2I0AAN4_9ASPA|nr:Putative E3 ubiquitin-protein ligase RING1a [Apostasia shenzhenica]
MECLHRFCRECIDKSMRLGNNECPACRTHCASRRSLRDDPNYDSLIAALYPDIDKYEEEELAFHEEEKNRNKKIQASIAETFRRQSEALGRRRSTAKATAAAFIKRSQGSYRTGQNSYLRGRGRAATRNVSPVVSDDEEEEDANSNDAGKFSSSAEEASPDRRPKRCRRVTAHRSSPARLTSNADFGSEENYDVELIRENFRTSPLQSGNRELSWGKGGARSQTRHGNSSGSNGRFIKAARLTKLIDYLRNLDEDEDKFEVHLTLHPLNEQSLPLESPYISCPPTLSGGQICQFIAVQTSTQVEGVDVFVRKPKIGKVEPSNQVESVKSELSDDLHLVGAEESLAGLFPSFTSSSGDLELVYRVNMRVGS